MFSLAFTDGNLLFETVQSGPPFLRMFSLLLKDLNFLLLLIKSYICYAYQSAIKIIIIIILLLFFKIAVLSAVPLVFQNVKFCFDCVVLLHHSASANN